MNDISGQVVYTRVSQPEVSSFLQPVDLTDKTMEERRKKVLMGMKREQIDVLLVYADREHGDNFSYLTGFSPRFEEAVLILHGDGRCFLLLGNEMLHMCGKARIPAKPVHVPYFSLPNQPMSNRKTMEGLVREGGIGEGMRAGICGWKLFTSSLEDNEQLYDVPYFIVDAVKKAVGHSGTVRSLGKIFLDPEHGARVCANANEIAHYEFGAALASDCVMDCMNRVEVGKTEMELAGSLAAYGQPITVQTICATGERFTNAQVAPRWKAVRSGDRFSISMGLEGGFTSRAAYAAAETGDLPENERDYLEKAAKPYYRGAAAWYSTIGLDITAGELYQAVETVLPKAVFGWELNPGHLTATEEWMSSPVYENSKIRLKSGMMLQMDIIPQVQGFGKPGAEDGIALADETLRAQIQEEYPQVWSRMQRRRRYMEQELGISLKEEVLPLSDLAGYYRPYLLNHDMALKISRQ